MPYFASKDDLPVPWKVKRIIFYRRGLKVYGQIPYILQRRLQAKFVSNTASLWGAKIVAPTGEDNYTIIPYRREDGQPHTDMAIESFLVWLYRDKGFEFGVAAPENFNDKLDLPNWWQSPPKLLKLADNDDRPILAGLLLAGDIKELRESDIWQWE